MNPISSFPGLSKYLICFCIRSPPVWHFLASKIVQIMLDTAGVFLVLFNDCRSFSWNHSSRPILTPKATWSSVFVKVLSIWLQVENRRTQRGNVNTVKLSNPLQCWSAEQSSPCCSDAKTLKKNHQPFGLRKPTVQIKIYLQSLFISRTEWIKYNLFKICMM